MLKMFGAERMDIWQNRRNGEAFSMDGGKTYYLISDRTKNMNFFKAPNKSAKMEVEEEMVSEETVAAEENEITTTTTRSSRNRYSFG